ncbi:hypothetical protein D3C84_207940 [compost metagenome]
MFSQWDKEILREDVMLLEQPNRHHSHPVRSPYPGIPSCIVSTAWYGQHVLFSGLQQDLHAHDSKSSLRS